MKTMWYFHFIFNCSLASDSVMASMPPGNSCQKEIRSRGYWLWRNFQSSRSQRNFSTLRHDCHRKIGGIKYLIVLCTCDWDVYGGWLSLGWGLWSIRWQSWTGKNCVFVVFLINYQLTNHLLLTRVKCRAASVDKNLFFRCASISWTYIVHSVSECFFLDCR